MQNKSTFLNTKTIVTLALMFSLLGNVYLVNVIRDRRRAAEYRLDRMVYEMGVIASLVEEMVTTEPLRRYESLLLPIQAMSSQVSLRADDITLFYPSVPQALKDAHIVQKLTSYMYLTIQTLGTKVILAGEMTESSKEQFTEIAAIYRLLEKGIVRKPRLSFRQGLFQEVAKHFKVLDNNGALLQLIESGR